MGSEAISDTLDSATVAAPDLASYAKIIIAFSGGKDSLACLLHLLDLSVAPARIELWHHDVDGREGSALMDWACTRDYCRKVAAAFGVAIYYSWKRGGFEREMGRDHARTAPIAFEVPSGAVREVGGTGGTLGTRLQFPQVDRADGRGTRHARHVDRWRPVHGWSETQVWALIERYRVNPHPAYRLGWGRVSCAACIFGNANQWASLQALDSDKFERVAVAEEHSGKTIQRKRSIRAPGARRGRAVVFDEQ